MQSVEFDPQPLLQVMADSIVADFGRELGVRLAERAISRLCGAQDEEALHIWLDVHALLLDCAKFNRKLHTLH